MKLGQKSLKSCLKKEELLMLAKNNEPRPPYRNSKLGQDLRNYISRQSPAFDLEFSILIKKLRPDWFETKKELSDRLSFENMISLMPSHVHFKEGQEWKGVKNSYIFICKTHGEFEAFLRSNYEYYSRVWSRGLSGHPNFDGVINTDTKQCFPSLEIAAKSINQTRQAISLAIKQKRKCNGYKWQYCRDYFKEQK